MVQRSSLSILSGEASFATGRRRPVQARALETADSGATARIDVVVKPTGAGFTPKQIACEVIGSALAAAFQLSVPRCWPLVLQRNEAAVLAHVRADIVTGPAFACEYVPNAVQVRTQNAVDVEAGARALLLDYLLVNVDRTVHNPNCLWRIDTLYLIDHEQCLEHVLRGTPRDENFVGSLCMLDHVFRPRLRAFVAQGGNLRQLGGELLSAAPAALAAARLATESTFAVDFDWTGLTEEIQRTQQNVGRFVHPVTSLAER